MAVAAFVVALLGLVVAVLALGWQVAAWALDGPRVKVVLREGAEGLGGIAAARVTKSGPPRDLTEVRGGGFSGPDLIGVTAINAGRAKVQVVRFGFELVEGGFSLEQHQSGRLSSPLPCWLEPGESGSWYIPMQDARALVFAARAVRANARGVRGHVELGDGRTRRTRAYLDVPPATV